MQDQSDRLMKHSLLTSQIWTPPLHQRPVVTDLTRVQVFKVKIYVSATKQPTLVCNFLRCVGKITFLSESCREFHRCLQYFPSFINYKNYIFFLWFPTKRILFFSDTKFKHSSVLEIILSFVENIYFRVDDRYTKYFETQNRGSNLPESCLWLG